MFSAFAAVDDLPRKKATQVKTQWGSAVREVQETGAVAVTSHDHVEVVVLSVERYEELAGLASAQRQAGLEFLAGRFQARLERMQAGAVRAGAAGFMDDDADFSGMETPPLVGSF